LEQWYIGIQERCHGKKTCLEEVRVLVGATEYESRSKKRRQDFTRKCKMPFKKLICFMFGMVKECSQNALERYFPKIKRATRMSRQASSLTWQKVKAEL
jgi:hypothetical protein